MSLGFRYEKRQLTASCKPLSPRGPVGSQGTDLSSSNTESIQGAKMLRTNRDRLIKMALGAVIAPPTLGRGPHRVRASGEPFVPIGMSGIIYNARPGCAAFGWAADHLEPAVCVQAQDPQEDYALH